MPTAHHGRDPATRPAPRHPAGAGTARHPLAALRHAQGWSGQRYLIEVNRHHQRLGFGAMATNRKKISQWESGLVTPELSAQLAIAALEHIPEEAVYRLGWPDWLLLALDHDWLTCTPWTLEATRQALIETASGGTMDRRGFLLATGTALTATAATWSALLSSTPASGKVYPRIGSDAINGLHARLTHLSHLDDVLGSGKLRELAAAELTLITGLLTDTTHSPTIERQLYSLAAEASRLCGWLSYDAGHHSAAQRYYLTALRASATADDILIGANTMAFMAVQHYSTGTPRDAITLTQTARTTLTKHSTPKTLAILHAREARAHAKLGDEKACAPALDAAFAALTTTADEPPWTYWITPTEIHMLAGSCALDLHQPHQALHHFSTAHTSFDTTTYPAGAAIYHARTAQTHLTLNNLDAAAHHATQALHCHATINSTRGDNTLTTLRNNLTPHHTHPAIHDLLDQFPQSHRATDERGQGKGLSTSWCFPSDPTTASKIMAADHDPRPGFNMLVFRPDTPGLGSGGWAQTVVTSGIVSPRNQEASMGRSTPPE